MIAGIKNRNGQICKFLLNNARLTQFILNKVGASILKLLLSDNYTFFKAMFLGDHASFSPSFYSNQKNNI